MARSSLVFIIAVFACSCARVDARPSLSLDGEWQFRFSPDDRGEKEAWFQTGAEFPHQLKVPGCWDNQGIGEPTEKCRHNAVGVGWYRRTSTVPAAWANRQVWLRVGGAHRSAKAWVNGQPVGEHWGYPVAFKFNITRFLKPQGDQTVVIAVDSRRHKQRDTLTGAFDIIDYMDVDWGGIFEAVTLEATGDVWLEDVFVMPNPAAGKARVRLQLGKAEGAAAQKLTVGYSVKRWSPDGPDSAPVDTGERQWGDQNALEWELNLHNAPLWTPETPNLLALSIALRRGQDAMDERTIRFGQRLVEIRGKDFYLNGERFFFRGYGDDYTFPRRISPSDVAYWKQYLAKRKEYGLIGVRHHSTMVPESYLTAADEVGILIQPELPIAYEPFYRAATKQGHDLYRYVWRTYITQMRNHPSVFSWCMGNELYKGFELVPELYKTAKELDPTRPVIDTDGLYAERRPTTDYLSIQFDEWSMPWGKRHNKHHLGVPVDRPVIVHEATNISVLPDPADIPKYDGTIRPFWLEQMAEQLRKRALGVFLPEMLSASRQLQASLIKLNMESARIEPDIDGHHQWLFRDYWTQSTGIVNQFDEVRALTPEMGRQFFGQAVVLWDHDRVNFRAGETIPLRMFVSDFRPKAAQPAIETVTVQVGERSATLQPPKEVGGRGLIGPWIGEMRADGLSMPRKLFVRATAGPVTNQWAIWVFPASVPEDPAAGKRENVHRTAWLSESVLEKLASGANVWVTGENMVFHTINARFKPAWWKGDDSTDHSYGNMILPHAALRGFPHDGYGDLQMFGMLDERPVVMMDDLPVRVDPIIWCLDVPWQMRPKAYLFEAKVGKGRLLVSTLNLSRGQRKEDPAAEWLLQRLDQYVRSDDFQPKAELPVDWLRSRVKQAARPDSTTWVEGFSKVIECVEKPTLWHSYRQDNVQNYPVRQTDGKQKVRWLTGAVPKDWPHDVVTFVWAGGIGWKSQPGGGHFSLAINGRHVLDFPFVQTTTTWKSPDGAARLQYLVLRSTNEDSFGLFLLTVPKSQVKAGEPVELTITATAQKSQRWFGLNPITDVVARERE
jgi:hypothetical protein